MADWVTLLNTIRANSSEMYQTRVPEATKTNLAEVGSGVTGYKETREEFLNTLINKVAMQVIHNKIFRNPLAVLKKGSMPLGKNIEEIYTNPATGTVFDPTGKDLLARNLPDTKVIYHARNRQGKYKVTVSYAQLVTAFTSYEELDKLLNVIVNTIYSGDNLEEFMLMKQVVAEGITGGKVKSVELDDIVDTATAKAFVKAVKTVGQDMQFPSSNYNCYFDINKDTDANPVITWTPLENQILLLRNDVSVNVDIELLAQAFNVSYTDLKQRTLVVDSFGTATNVGALLCDEAFFQIRDNLQQMEHFHNGEGLYDNYIWHHWQTYGISLFANAMAFTFKGETVEEETGE